MSDCVVGCEATRARGRRPYPSFIRPCRPANHNRPFCKQLPIGFPPRQFHRTIVASATFQSTKAQFATSPLAHPSTDFLLSRSIRSPSPTRLFLHNGQQADALPFPLVRSHSVANCSSPDSRLFRHSMPPQRYIERGMFSILWSARRVFYRLNCCWKMGVRPVLRAIGTPSLLTEADETIKCSSTAIEAMDLVLTFSFLFLAPQHSR